MRLESVTLARVLHNVKGRESVLDMPMALPEFGILVGCLPVAQSVRENGRFVKPMSEASMVPATLGANQEHMG